MSKLTPILTAQSMIIDTVSFKMTHSFLIEKLYSILTYFDRDKSLE